MHILVKIWNKICHTVNSCGDFFMIGPPFTRFWPNTPWLLTCQAIYCPIIQCYPNNVHSESYWIVTKLLVSFRNVVAHLITRSWLAQTGGANWWRSTDFRNADQRFLIFLSKAWSQVIKMPRLCLKDAWIETPAERNLANPTQVEYRNIAHSDRRVVSLSKKHLGLLSESTDNTLEAVAPVPTWPEKLFTEESNQPILSSFPTKSQ